MEDVWNNIGKGNNITLWCDGGLKNKTLASTKVTKWQRKEGSEDDESNDSETGM